MNSGKILLVLDLCFFEIEKLQEVITFIIVAIFLQNIRIKIKLLNRNVISGVNCIKFINITENLLHGCTIFD